MRLYWPKKICLVQLLEIECVIEGKPDARIFELVAAKVEDERLHNADIVDREFLEDDALVRDGGEIVGGGPVLGAVFIAPVDAVHLERFDGDGRVAEIFEAQLVEVVAADVDVEAFAPMVLDALVDDVATGRELLDAIGAAAERRLERGFADVALLAVLSVPSHHCLRRMVSCPWSAAGRGCRAHQR